tara:strand:+ start:1957 stop:2274 length:318 start_codon:yes stop_codon:yes gene_type:complete
MFFKNTNKEVIMDNKKTKATAEAAETLKEALVLRPEWEIKPKSKISTQLFTVYLNETAKVLELNVNGELYKQIPVQDVLTGQIKFHDALSHVIAKFDLWGLHAKN